MCSLSRCAAFAALVLPHLLHATTRSQDRSLVDVPDATLRAEIGQLGYYPETLGRDTVVPLVHLPLRSWSEGHVEFADESVRVRIEAQPFHGTGTVKHRPSGYAIEGHPITGWTVGAEHRRVGRVELMLDGRMVEMPMDAYTDLFDPRLCEAGPASPLLYATAARSLDGWRIYVLAQMGEGAEARMVTWVFEDGRYLCRVVDAFRVNGY